MSVHERGVLAGHPGRMLASVAIAWAVLQTGRFLLSPLLPALIADLGITEATAGLALTAFQLVYAVTQYPSGRYSDAVGRSALLVPGLGVLVVAFVAVGVATSYAAFLVGMVLLGVGKGLYAIPSRALLSDLFVENRGRALGLYTAGTDLGGIVAAGVAAYVLAVATWRVPFVPLAGVMFLTGAVYVAWSRESPRPDGLRGTDLELGRTVRRLATTRAQRETLVAYSLFYFVVGGWVNFLPTYLARGKAFPDPLPQLGFALLFAVGLLAKPVSGALSDRLPRRTLAVAGLLLGAASLLVVVLASTPAGVGVGIALMAAGYKTQFPIVDALLLDAAPEANAGGDLGAARALFLGVGALGPTYVGVVATYADYVVALAGLAGCLVVAAGVLARGRLRERRRAGPA